MSLILIPGPSMGKPSARWEIVFWLVCLAGVALAMWQYGSLFNDTN